MNATTTCSFTAPLDFSGTPPTAITDVWNYSVESCTTTNDLSTTGGFTYGEMVTSLFAFLLLVIVSYSFLYRWVRGHKIHI